MAKLANAGGLNPPVERLTGSNPVSGTMKIHRLISELLDYDPDADVLIVCANGSVHQIEDLDLDEQNRVVIEAVREEG